MSQCRPKSDVVTIVCSFYFWKCPRKRKMNENIIKYRSFFPQIRQPFGIISTAIFSQTPYWCCEHCLTLSNCLCLECSTFHLTMLLNENMRIKNQQKAGVWFLIWNWKYCWSAATFTTHQFSERTHDAYIRRKILRISDELFIHIAVPTHMLSIAIHGAIFQRFFFLCECSRSVESNIKWVYVAR